MAKRRPIEGLGQEDDAVGNTCGRKKHKNETPKTSFRKRDERSREKHSNNLSERQSSNQWRLKGTNDSLVILSGLPSDIAEVVYSSLDFVDVNQNASFIPLYLHAK